MVWHGKALRDDQSLDMQRPARGGPPHRPEPGSVLGSSASHDQPNGRKRHFLRRESFARDVVSDGPTP